MQIKKRQWSSFSHKRLSVWMMYSEHKQRIYRFISAISTQTHTSVRSLVTNPTTKPTHHTTLSKTFPCDDQQTVLKVGHLKVYSPCGDIWSSLSHTHTHMNPLMCYERQMQIYTNASKDFAGLWTLNLWVM